MTDKEETFFRRRMEELCGACYQKNIPTHSRFLNADEQTVFRSMHLSAPGVRIVSYGGPDAAERKIICFLPDYQPEVPEDTLCFLKISPVSEKFAEALSHRDYLGALMSLGIERSMLGDIFMDGSSAHLAALPEVRDTILDELTEVRRTRVKVASEGLSDVLAVQHTEIVDVNTASCRADSLVCAVFRISRGGAKTLFAEHRVFRNGAELTDGSKEVRPGDVISVREKGRFRLLDGIRETKKGRLYVPVELFR